MNFIQNLEETILSKNPFIYIITEEEQRFEFIIKKKYKTYLHAL